MIETVSPLGPALRTAAHEARLTYADAQMRGQRPPCANYLPA